MGDNAPDYQDNLYFEPKKFNTVKELNITNIPIVSNEGKPKQKVVIEMVDMDDEKIYLPLRDDLTNADITSFIYNFTRCTITNEYSISYNVINKENI